VDGRWFYEQWRRIKKTWALMLLSCALDIGGTMAKDQIGDWAKGRFGIGAGRPDEQKPAEKVPAN
jgi:hypothetical protein